MPDSPFDEDCIITQAAEAAGLDVRRSRVIEITDMRAIKAAGLVKESADYARIRRLLEDGETVNGAELRGVEYVLRPTKGG